MTHITNITFWTYGKNEGITCSNCGAYIRNVYTVTYSDGFVAHYGTECFDKLWKSGKLSKFGEKEFRRILKNIKFYNGILAQWQECKTDQDIIDKHPLFSDDYLIRYNESEYCQKRYKQSAYYKWTAEQYIDMVVNGLIPYRLNKEQKELEKFSKIDFKQLLKD